MKHCSSGHRRDAPGRLQNGSTCGACSGSGRNAGHTVRGDRAALVKDDEEPPDWLILSPGVQFSQESLDISEQGDSWKYCSWGRGLSTATGAAHLCAQRSDALIYSSNQITWKCEASAWKGLITWINIQRNVCISCKLLHPVHEKHADPPYYIYFCNNIFLLPISVQHRKGSRL